MLAALRAQAQQARQKLTEVWAPRDLPERVAEWCQIVAGERPEEPGAAQQEPFYFPRFPGLRAQAWHDPADYPWAEPLRSLIPALQAELERLLAAPDRFLSYFQNWTLYPLRFMGVRTPGHPCSLTESLEALPELCADHLWGDLTFSLLTPGAHLPAHCSADNLRIRCHAGLKVPEGPWLRVGEERRAWREGDLLAFDDSFEHEVGNPSSEVRAVLIADFWHPDLSAEERAALRRLLGTPAVRKLYAPFRSKPTPELWAALEA